MQSNQAGHSKRYLLFFIFFLSGFSGLIYESIWSHYIKLIAGHAAYAQAFVLTIFMGGLAIGAWLASLFSHRIRNPLLWYAIIEGIIGVFGILFHREFLFFHDILFGIVANTELSGFWFESLKWLFSSMLLLPQAILLGATFPLMSAAIIRLYQNESGYILSMLYFTNSIGAALGVLVSGFVLIAIVGLPGTSLTAGLLNIVVAVTAWLIANRLELKPVETSTHKLATVKGVSVFLGIAFFTGLASFIYEIAWIRMLSLVLGSSMQAFELMLAAFISGIAIGSYIIRKRLDSLKDPTRTLATVQILMGLFALATLPVYVYSFDLMAFFLNSLTRTDSGYLLFNLSSQFIAYLIMLPATIMAGMTLPLITHILITKTKSERVIGRVYAYNTLGAIAGIIIASQWLMPLIGLKRLVLVGGLLDIALGLLILFLWVKVTFVRRIVVTAGSVLIAVSLASTDFSQALLSSGIFRSGVPVTTNEEDVVYYSDGKTASVAVIAKKDGKSILTNGKPDASIHNSSEIYSGDETTMTLLATLPMLHRDVKLAANIGFGSGLTSHILLTNKAIETLDTIEIEPKMVEGARHFGDKVALTFSDPRSNIIIDDAKSYFSSQTKKYDVIISEPSNPWVNGVASLYTQEFYRRIKASLISDGILVQWFHLYENNRENLASVLNALSAEFSHLGFYFTNSYDIIVLASNSRLNQKLTSSERFENLSDPLNHIDIYSLADVNVRYLGDKNTLQAIGLINNGLVNSDYFPSLSLNAPKAFFKKGQILELEALLNHPIPVIRWLNNRLDLNFNQSVTMRSRFNFYNHRSQALALLNKQGDVNDTVTFYNALISNCASLASGELMQLNHRLALMMVPYLSHGENKKFWQQMKGCVNQENQSEQLSLWLDFYDAVGQMDSATVISFGQRLLDSESIPQSQREYVVIAVLTAQLANKNNRVIKTMLASNPWISDSARGDNMLRMLLVKYQLETI